MSNSSSDPNVPSDTLPRAEALVRTLLMQRSGEERLMMAADMFSAARTLIEASLREEGLQPGTAEWKLRLLDRTYGDEISPAVRRRLLERWRATDAGRTPNETEPVMAQVAP